MTCSSVRFNMYDGVCTGHEEDLSSLTPRLLG